MPIGINKLKSLFGSNSEPPETDAYITVYDGKEPPVLIDLSAYGKSDITFGRGEGNDIRLKSIFASRRHGRFILSSGKCVIENNPESTNGLKCGGCAILSKVLKDGDEIRIGDAEHTADDDVRIVFTDNNKYPTETVFAASINEQGIHGKTQDEKPVFDVFISHASEDLPLAEQIYDKLAENGVICWLDSRSIRAGYKYTSEIMYGIKNCAVFLLLFSDNANESHYCYNEAERAVAHKKWIITYRLSDIEMTDDFEFLLSTSQWITAASDIGFEKLISEIKNILTKEKQ